MKTKTVYINYKNRTQKLLKEKMNSLIVGICVIVISLSLVAYVGAKNSTYLKKTASSPTSVSPTPATGKEKGTITPQAATTGRVTFTGNSYIVQEGETLSDVAQKVYGDATMWTKLQQANNIQNPDVVPAGTVLTIPRQ